jgi:hypothetical protein
MKRIAGVDGVGSGGWGKSKEMDIPGNVRRNGSGEGSGVSVSAKTRARGDGGGRGGAINTLWIGRAGGFNMP